MTHDPNGPLLWGHSQAVPQGESAAAQTAGHKSTYGSHTSF